MVTDCLSTSLPLYLECFHLVVLHLVIFVYFQILVILFYFVIFLIPYCFTLILVFLFVNSYVLCNLLVKHFGQRLLLLNAL